MGRYVGDEDEKWRGADGMFFHALRAAARYPGLGKRLKCACDMTCVQ